VHLHPAQEEIPEMKEPATLDHLIRIDKGLTRWNELRRDQREPFRWTVVQVGTPHGLTYLFAPGFFTEKLSIAWEGGTHAEAARRMGEGYDIIKAVHGDEAAKIFWRGQRLILVGCTGNRYADFPTW
jgi:hypothetical protein